MGGSISPFVTLQTSAVWSWVVVLLPSPAESRSSTSAKPEGCHAKEHAEPKQPVQAPEEPMGVVSSCGHVDPLEERFASWIGQQNRPFPRPMNGWRTESAPDATKCLSGQLLSRALLACVSSSAVSGDPSWSMTCEKWKNANSRN